MSSGLAASTLTKLKRLSMMRQPNKPRTIGSGTEFDAMLADSGLTRASLGSLDRTLSSPATAADKEQLDEHGNPILGGELLVKVWDAQVRTGAGLLAPRRPQWPKRKEEEPMKGNDVCPCPAPACPSQVVSVFSVLLERHVAGAKRSAFPIEPLL